MLFPIFLLYVTSYVSAKFCEKNQYWSTFLERCENCSRCVRPEIVIRPCQRHENTVCGTLSELNLDWSFLRHSDSGSTRTTPSTSEKEMLQTFEENFEGIRQHEKHVREKERYMHRQRSRQKSRKGDSGEDYNEIEGGDGLDRKALLEKFRKLVEEHSTGEDGSKRDKSMKLFQTLLRFPVVLDSFSGNRLHFDDDEAFELLRGGKKKKMTGPKDSYDPSRLKYDERGVLVKGFGFSHPDDDGDYDVEDTVKMQKLVDDGKVGEDVRAEKESPDWRLVIAAGLLVTHTVIIVLVASYCIRKNGKKIKGYFVTDMGEVQTWILPKEKESRYPSSGIYKPTTEVRKSGSGGLGGSKCKYLDRLINMNVSGKKKVNFYVGVKLPPEMKPLTGKYPETHKPVGERV